MMGIFGRKSNDSNSTEDSSSQNKNTERSQPTIQSDWETSTKTNDRIKSFKEMAYEALMERIDLVAANKLTPAQLRREVEQFISDLSSEKKLHINEKEQKQLASSLVDEMVGLGPLEEVIHDNSISDILVNGPDNIYVERSGRLAKTNVKFYDEAHVEQIARRIASRVGRRIDESSPMVDARLSDGSRVNIIMPPLALNGTSISIRKFSEVNLTFDKLVENHSISKPMSQFLKVVAACRLNTLISGGTGSGKTTLLNAMSQLIDPNERIITIEDSAELRLQQPHVVRLESRPPNIEGEGEITIRDLLRNTLRMRPDRIIVGEVRGDETIDMLQAMNTGHDGSMSTIHANRPREALTRLENMMMLSGYEMPTRIVRAQIVGAINLVVHTERMRDGVRRVTEIAEITGMEGEVITMHTLFKFEFQENVMDEKQDKTIIRGKFTYTGILPQFLPRVQFYGLDKELKESLKSES
jgi:pilus assembly protein CpaF